MKKIYLFGLITLVTVLLTVPLTFAHTVIINPKGNVITIKPDGYSASDVVPSSVTVTYGVIPIGGGDTEYITLDPIKVAANNMQLIIVLSANEVPPYANSTAINVYVDGFGPDIISGPPFAWSRR
jgi:hypothetical protein